jgi:hypothetical protein
MKRIMVAILAAVWLPTASAGVLYKCISPKGHTSVQSEPCAVGHKTVWARGYVPERTVERPRKYSTPPPSTIYYPEPSNPTPSPRQQQRARCEQARAWEAQQRRTNPDLNYDQLLALQEKTAEACRGL